MSSESGGGVFGGGAEQAAGFRRQFDSTIDVSSEGVNGKGTGGEDGGVAADVGNVGALGKKRAAEGHVPGEELGYLKRQKALSIGGDGKRRLVVLRGLAGMYTDVLEGFLKREAIPFCNLVKKQVSDTAQLELPDDKAILAGCCRVLDNQSIKGKIIQVAYDEGLQDVQPQPCIDKDDSSSRGLVRQVAPLYDMEYEEQLAFKRSLLLGSLRKVTLEMGKEHGRVQKESDGKQTKLPGWVLKACKGPCLDIGKVHSSPTIRGYRNKNEFTVGFGSDGKPMVGFRYGKYMDGRKGVGCADGCPNIPEVALCAARCMTDFVRNHTDLQPWGQEHHSGVWRLMLVRNSRDGELMAIVQYSANNVERTILDIALQKMKAFLVEEAKQGRMRLTSLYGHEHNGISNKAADDCPMVHMWGEKYFYENLLALRFRISPAAFFQVNTTAAELLNSRIRDWAAAGENQVVLDVCCGTGTIGICISSCTKKVVGIEMCVPAVVDAEANAAANDITNCIFLAGKAEDKIREAIQQHVPAGTSCVAVVDPPREGLHKKVLGALRATKEIERIVYVSCDHTRFVEQALLLCSHARNDLIGEPFEPVAANGVDLFPHTAHVELVVLLERGPTLTKRRRDEEVEDGHHLSIEEGSCCGEMVAEGNVVQLQEEESINATKKIQGVQVIKVMEEGQV